MKNRFTFTGCCCCKTFATKSQRSRSLPRAFPTHINSHIEIPATAGVFWEIWQDILCAQQRHSRIKPLIEGGEIFCRGRPFISPWRLFDRPSISSQAIKQSSPVNWDLIALDLENGRFDCSFDRVRRVGSARGRIVRWCRELSKEAKAEVDRTFFFTKEAARKLV